MDLWIVALLLAAGLAGGFVNALAGGATFFTFPAMLAAGLPPVTANASNAVAVWPGNLSGAIAFRRQLPPLTRTLWLAMGLALLGAAGGALLLLATAERVFLSLVPWLILGATLLFAFARPLLRLLRHLRPARAVGLTPGSFVLQAVTAVYGGYFGGGLGIMLLAVLSLCGFEDIRVMNAVKNLLSALVGLVTLLIFAGLGAVAWPETLVMLAGAVAGGWLGGRIGQRAPAWAIRGFVIVVGLTLSAYYFTRG
jgi:uncharacterized membrane protein YfcA